MKRQIPTESTPLLNIIFEKLALSLLPAYEYKIIFAVIRKTYGWQKKKDWISGSQLSELTGIAEKHCFGSVRALIKKKIIIKYPDGQIGLEKNTDNWTIPIQGVPIQGQMVPIQGSITIPIQGDTKETTKETNTIKKVIKKEESNEPPKRTRKKKTSVDGEVFRKQDDFFDGFLDQCKDDDIFPAISLKAYLKLEKKYKARIPTFHTEAKSCVSWCDGKRDETQDPQFNKVTANRLSNRMKFFLKFQKENEVKQLQKFQEKKEKSLLGIPQNPVVTKKTVPSVPYLDCIECGNVQTKNQDGICNYCLDKV